MALCSAGWENVAWRGMCQRQAHYRGLGGAAGGLSTPHSLACDVGKEQPRLPSRDADKAALVWVTPLTDFSSSSDGRIQK